jgi:hypothetical protein
MIINLSKDWIYQQYVRELVNGLRTADFYYDGSNKVMTESYHKRRGICCGNGCRHCPYNPTHQKGNTILNEDIF